MPETEIINSLRGLRMNELTILKNYWLTSMSSIIRKAKDLKCIDENRYKFFMIEMSRNGYNRREPVDVFIDNPTCFKNAYNLFKENFAYTTEDFINFTALPKDIIEDVFSINNTVRLRIVR